jgi:hypothetical protein
MSLILKLLQVEQEMIFEGMEVVKLVYGIDFTASNQFSVCTVTARLYIVLKVFLAFLLNFRERGHLVGNVYMTQRR